MARNARMLISPQMLTYAVVGLLCVALPILLLTDFWFVPFALVLGFAFMTLVLYSPFLGLVIYTVFLLIRPQEWIGILQAVPMPIERPLAIFLLVSVLLRSILRSEVRLKLRAVDSTLLIFVSMVLLSVFFGGRIQEAWDEWQDVAKLALLHFIVAAVIRNKQELKLYVLWVLGLSVAYSLWSLRGYYGGMRQYRMGIWRAIGPDTSYGGPNSLAISLVSIFPLFFYSIRKDLPRYVNMAIYGSMAVLVWNVILTGSRTGMSGLLFCFLLLMWQGRYRVRNIMITSVALVCIWFVMPEQYRQRFESTTEIEANEDDRTGASLSASARIEGIFIGLRMVADRPAFGWGIGNFGWAAGNHYNPDWWAGAHTIIGQTLGEIGLIGTASFILWLFAMFKALSALRRYYVPRNDEFMAKTALAARSMLVVLLVLGLGGHNMFRYSWFLISAITVAMLKVMEQDMIAERTTAMSEPIEQPAVAE